MTRAPASTVMGGADAAVVVVVVWGAVTWGVCCVCIGGLSGMAVGVAVGVGVVVDVAVLVGDGLGVLVVAIGGEQGLYDAFNLLWRSRVKKKPMLLLFMLSLLLLLLLLHLMLFGGWGGSVTAGVISAFLTTSELETSDSPKACGGEVDGRRGGLNADLPLAIRQTSLASLTGWRTSTVGDLSSILSATGGFKFNLSMIGGLYSMLLPTRNLCSGRSVS